MKAMILAAGLGQRMAPLTLSIPKPALPVLGRPIVLQIARWLDGAGVEEIAINLHHRAEIVQATLKPELGALRPRVHYFLEPLVLGTAGGLANAAGLLRGSEQIVVVNSDALTDLDLAAAVDAHRRSGMPATIVLVPAREGYGRVDVDAVGRVLSLAGLPRCDRDRIAGSHLFAGVQILDEALLDELPSTAPTCLVRDFLRPLAAAGRLRAHFHDGFWWEFGSPMRYLDGSLELLDLSIEARRRVLRDHDPIRTVDGALAAIGPGLERHPDSQLHGRAVLGFACHLNAGCHVEDSVVMAESWIGPGCRLRRAIIGPAVELPAGFVGDDVMVCNDPDPATEPPPAARRVGGLLVLEFAAGRVA